MKNNIIKNLPDLEKNPKLCLRLNAEFKDMGFKSVENKKRIEDSSFFKELTLAINPSLNVINQGYVEISGSVNTALRNRTNRLDYYPGTQGFYLPELDCAKDEMKIQITITANSGAKSNHTIGKYYQNRNLVILGVSVLSNILGPGLDNKWAFYYIEQLKEWMKENKRKIKKINVKKKIEDMMIEQFSKSAKDNLKNKSSSIVSYRRDIISYEHSIVNNFKEIKYLDAEIIGLNKLIKNSSKIVKKQIEEIKKLKFVKSVELTGEGIKVDIGEINILHGSKNVRIGDFEINFLANQFKIKNKNSPCSHFHPHMNSEGDMCFGSRREQTYKLLADLDFKKLTYFIYLALKGYNTDDCYYQISNWVNANAELKRRQEPVLDASPTASATATTTTSDGGFA